MAPSSSRLSVPDSFTPAIRFLNDEIADAQEWGLLAADRGFRSVARMSGAAISHMENAIRELKELSRL